MHRWMRSLWAEVRYCVTHTSKFPKANLVALMAGYAPYDFTTFQRRPHDHAVGLCEIAFTRESGILRTHLGWESPDRSIELPRAA